MNMLDNLKKCVLSSHSSRAGVAGTDIESSSSSSTSTIVKRVSGMNTLVNFVKQSRKKVGEETKILIHERTAALVAAAHLPYCIIELESLKNFA